MEFNPHPRAEERKRSARVLVETLLHAKGLLSTHRREFLSKALWKVTEAEGVKKHKTRYCSKPAIRQVNNLLHDHVLQRANMVKKLIANPDDVEKILNDAIGCTITKGEHTLLDKFKSLDGWERYRQAGIEVIDTKTGKVFKFPAPAVKGV